MTGTSIMANAVYEASKYVKHIRNAAKKSYAQAYHAWVLSGRPGHNGPEWDRSTLSYMAAQGVRMNIDYWYPYIDEPSE